MRKTRLIQLLIFAICFSNCSTSKQGVEGRITQVSKGNLSKTQLANNEGGVNTNILITIALAYDEIPKKSKGFYETPDEKLIVKRTKSDANGNFRVSLSAGVYTVLLETKDGWFAKERDKNGVLNKITVEGKELITKNFEIEKSR